MGKGKGKAKIEIQRIDCLKRRNVFFSKRRQGLFKKADEIRRLFPGTRVAALVFSPAGKPYFFGDPNALLGAEQKADGNQFNLEPDKASSSKEEKSKCLDWESANENRIWGSGESESDGMNKSSGSEWDLGDLASHYMIESIERRLDCDSLDENQIWGSGKLESMLMSESFGDDFLGDVESFANQLPEL